MSRRRHADPFKVWGTPAESLLKRLRPRERAELKRYVRRLAGKVYRFAYDCGVDAAKPARRR